MRDSLIVECPRCGGGVPNDETPGAYPGAISRWDNKTEICSQCGSDEAMIQMMASMAQADPRAAITPDKRPWVTFGQQWTVISVTESEGQVLADHVLADSEWNAFAAAAQLREGSSDVQFIGAVPGHLQVAVPTDSGVSCFASDYPYGGTE
jgi:hypothetical protein